MRKGFTLIELLVVVSIIALLSSIVLSGLSGTREKARIISLVAFDNSVRSTIGDGLISEYTFDEGSGTVLSDINSDNDGTIAGASWSEDAVLGQALYFQDRIDRVSLGTSDTLKNLDEFTVSAWVKLDSYHTYGVLGLNGTDCCSGTASGYVLWGSHYGGAPSLQIWNSGSNFHTKGDNTATRLELNKWHHVLGSYDGSTARLFINGELIQTVSNSLGLGTDNTSSTSIGNLGSSFGLDDGRVDTVRIYSKAYIPESLSLSVLIRFSRDNCSFVSFISTVKLFESISLLPTTILAGILCSTTFLMRLPSESFPSSNATLMPDFFSSLTKSLQ